MKAIMALLLVSLAGHVAPARPVEAQIGRKLQERLKQKATERKSQAEEDLVTRATEPADSALERVAIPIESAAARAGATAGAAIGGLGRGETVDEARIRDGLSAGHLELPEVVFAPGSDALKPSSEPTLLALARALIADAGVFLVQGGSEPMGEPAAALTLGRQRAAAVKTWLVAHDVPLERVFAAGGDNPQALSIKVVRVQ